MITKFNLKQATVVLPLTSDMDECDQWERLNTFLGAYVLVEIDYTTKNFIKLDFDYSLIEYDDLKYAKQKVDQLYAYVKEYWGIDTPVDEIKWKAESKAFLIDYVERDIKSNQKYVNQLLTEGPEFTYNYSSWFDKTEAESADNIEIASPVITNPKGQVWAKRTIKQWPTVSMFNDRVKEYKDMIEVSRNKLNKLVEVA
jgi:hypothetical protein